jgi:hypothetical protein
MDERPNVNRAPTKSRSWGEGPDWFSHFFLSGAETVMVCRMRIFLEVIPMVPSNGKTLFINQINEQTE